MGTTKGHEKDYGRDPAKRRARRKFLEFIEKTFDRTSYGDTTILFLGGQELHEFNEVVALIPGIKEKNLSIVERDKFNARLIQASLPKAEVYAGELIDYVSKTDRKFDIISLDFCTNLTPHVQGILTVIRERELLKDHGVLMTAITGRREQDQAKEGLRHMVELRALHETPEKSAESAMFGHKVPLESVERNLPEARSEAFSHFLACTLLGGSNAVYLQWLVDQDSNDLLRRVEFGVLRRYVELVLRKDAGTLQDKYDLPLERKDGGTASAFGVTVGLPSRLTCDEMEDALEIVRKGDVRIVEGDDSVSQFDFENGIFYISKRNFSYFQKNLWGVMGALGPVVIDEAAKEDRIDYIMYNLFKTALLEIFKEDLDSVEIKVPGGGVVQFPFEWRSGLVFEYVMSGRAGVYWITGHERYKYVSDSSCPMLVDMIAVDRRFTYDNIIVTSTSGHLVPNFPEKVLRTRNRRKILKAKAAMFEDFERFMSQISKAMYTNKPDSEYPERIELERKDEDMARNCENCKRLEREMDLIQKQMVEMRTMLKSKKVIRKAMKIGDFERMKICQMLDDGIDTDEICKSLNVSANQVAAVKAWRTMAGKDYYKDGTEG